MYYRNYAEALKLAPTPTYTTTVTWLVGVKRGEFQLSYKSWVPQTNLEGVIGETIQSILMEQAGSARPRVKLQTQVGITIGGLPICIISGHLI